MSATVIVAPLLPGKLDAWKQWAAELNGPRRAEFEDHQKRFGVDREVVWLQETPEGAMAVVLNEGEGAEGRLPKIAASDHPFDVWFADKVKEVHGLDISGPPPGPPPQKYIEYSA